MSAEEARKFELADCEAVFAAAEPLGAATILVGGQAVYFWAARYQHRCAALDLYLPYTSKDADYLGAPSAAYQLAQSLSSRFQPAIQKGGMRGLCLGFIELPGNLKLEILGRINGVRQEVVRDTVVRTEWHGKIMHVIHPLQLFIAKAHNLLEIDQSNRQDGKHFAIMHWVLRMLLADLTALHEPEATEALLDSCETLLKFFLTDTGLKLLLGAHLPLPILWPDLAPHPSAKVQNFLRHRLPRWQQQLNTALDQRRARARFHLPATGG